MEKGAVIKHDIKKAPKTGDWRYMKPEINKEKCTGCGTCVKYCPEAVIELTANNEQRIMNKKGKAILPARLANARVAGVDYHFCKGCGVCASVCPVKAIHMIKEADCINCGTEEK
ncbi:pyruvate synthase subunit PorD [bacterium BMS3Abin15]|nr:pyruvate synthase subunit PorD [bacterium BMS3Abin15]